LAQQVRPQRRGVITDAPKGEAAHQVSVEEPGNVCRAVDESYLLLRCVALLILEQMASFRTLVTRQAGFEDRGCDVSTQPRPSS
jgi:hypothetical protein